MKRKLLLVETAGLGFDRFARNADCAFWKPYAPHPAQTVFPALTSPVQCSVRTALPPEEHGMVMSGRYDRTWRKALFWEQSSRLYQGERVWKKLRENGGTVGQLCIQQSLGEPVDFLLSPQPIHKHHGGMIMDCYTQPSGLYPEICRKVGAKFKLMSYWGPLASNDSTRWIAGAASAIMEDARYAPDLFYIYLPHMDYCQQKFGPYAEKSDQAYAWLEKRILPELFKRAAQAGYDIVFFGDYAITPAHEAIYPNRILRRSNFFRPRMLQGMCYGDMWNFDAFAVVDHQLTHIVVDAPEKEQAIRACFDHVPGIKRLFSLPAKTVGEHDFFLEADAGYFFAYPWWEANEKGPDFATHVDIHNKPGFDPCELFFDFYPFSITQDTSRVRGTHGNAEHPIVLASNIPEYQACDSLLGMAELLRGFGA